MDDIKNIISGVIGKMAEQKPCQQEKIERIWINVLNEAERGHTQLQGMKEGMLSVNVDSSIFFYHMNVKKRSILEKLKKECPEVKYIRFKIGKVK